MAREKINQGTSEQHRGSGCHNGSETNNNKLQWAGRGVTETDQLEERGRD